VEQRQAFDSVEDEASKSLCKFIYLGVGKL
jgi:hypothetical protein